MAFCPEPRLNPASPMHHVGTVKLTRIVRDAPSRSGSRCFSASTRHLVPHKKRAGSQQTVVSRPEQMTPHAKEIPNEAMHRQESLRVSGGFETPHLSLAL